MSAKKDNTSAQSMEASTTDEGSSETPQKLCFVISPIGDAGTQTRKHSDTVLEYIIKPIAEALGYEVVRADQLSDPGVITHQIIKHLVEDDLVIADLTERNPNVFYELAARHATTKPTIQLIDENEKLPFDVANMRAIPFSLQDVRSYERCKDDLRKQIFAAEKEGSTENPLSQAINLLGLLRRGPSADKAIADIGVAVGDLTGAFQRQQAEFAQLSILVGKDPPFKVARIAGLGSGLYTHSLGRIPDIVLLQPGSAVYGVSMLGGSASGLSYDSATPTTIHVNAETPGAWTAILIAFNA